MAKKPNSIDGFYIPRRAPKNEGERIGIDKLQTTQEVEAITDKGRKDLQSDQALNRNKKDLFMEENGDLAEEIEQELGSSKKQRKFRKDKAFKKPRSKKRRITKWAIIIVLLTVVGIGAYFGIKFFITTSQITKGNVFTALFNQGEPLKEDENGWSNIAVFGTSEDDPSHVDAGPDLADSIMMVSVNQKLKKAFTVSVPRDLQVDYGKACNSGYSGKINEVYGCSSSESEEAGQTAMRTVVGKIFGVDVQYSVHLNYTVLRETVDAVGGITVDISGDDPRGILDRNFDWMCQYKCYYVKYPNGPANLDGVHALALARARGDVAPTYGLSRSNPDREDNQRKILVALQQKAVSGGTLANPIAVNNLLSALGNNLRTSFDASEIKTLLGLGKDISADAIKSISLYNPENILIASCGSNQCPVGGTYNYSAIQSLVNAYTTDNLSALEGAKVDVLNATETMGVASTKAAELTKEKITVEVTGNAPASYAASGAVQLYDLSNGKKPETLKKLENLLGVKAIAGLPQGVSSSSDFVIIIGNGSQ